MASVVGVSGESWKGLHNDILNSVITHQCGSPRGLAWPSRSSGLQSHTTRLVFFSNYLQMEQIWSLHLENFPVIFSPSPDSANVLVCSLAIAEFLVLQWVLIVNCDKLHCIVIYSCNRMNNNCLAKTSRCDYIHSKFLVAKTIFAAGINYFCQSGFYHGKY